jgi:heme A synthase
MGGSKRYATYAWIVLAYNVLVILWGAYVRATGSGAGCGSHWPLCNGEIVPQAPQLETMIEFAHRVTSGLSLFLVAGLVVWGFRLYERGHLMRRPLVLSGVFIILEALLGAGLVLFELTAENDSLARAISMPLHLVNTFLLLFVLAFTAWWASGFAPVQFRGQRGLAVAWWLALAGVLVVGMTGAVTALGDTLFPSESLVEGFQADFSPTAHFLVRFRVWHPFFAVGTGLYVVLLARFISTRRGDALTQRLAYVQMTLFVVQIIAGAVNVALLAPVWMQIVHLALAVAVWVSLVLLGAAAFAHRKTPVREAPASNLAETPARP